MEKDIISDKIRSLYNHDITDNLLCYIGTNERNLSNTEKVLRNDLAHLNVKDNRVHIGFSGYFNFDIAYWRKSNRIIICDINPSQVKLLKQSIIYICQSNNRHNFIKNISEYLNSKHNEMIIENRDKFYYNHKGYKYTGLRIYPNISSDESYIKLKDKEFSGDAKDIYLDQIKYELIRTGSWLSSDDSYYYIRNLALKDLIAIFCEDIRSTDIFVRIKNILSNNYIIVDTIYLSNIYDFMENDKDILKYNLSLKTLCCLKTLIIEAN